MNYIRLYPYSAQLAALKAQYAALGALADKDSISGADIDADAVSNAKLANMAEGTIKGRAAGGGAGDPGDLTGAQARVILNVADGATANDTDANLKNRANHTGTQAISTVAGLQAALDGKASAAQGAKADTAVQPAGLTKAAVGLGSVDNTSDANKPISTAVATALAGKASAAQGAKADTAVQPDGLTKAAVGLGNVDNTADAAKPISTAQAVVNGQVAAKLDPLTALIPQYPDRAGDARALFSQALTGDPVARAAIAIGTVVHVTDYGAALRISGDDTDDITGYADAAARVAWPIYLGRTYRVTFRLARALDATDPLNNAVQLRWQNLNGSSNKGAVSNVQLGPDLVPMVANGLIERDFLVGKAGAPGTLDITIPPTAIYGVPLVRVFGNGQETDVVSIDIKDVTDAIVGGGDASEIALGLAQEVARATAAEAALSDDLLEEVERSEQEAATRASLIRAVAGSLVGIFDQYLGGLITVDPQTGDLHLGGLTAKGAGSTHGVDLGDLHGQVSISYSPRTGDLYLGGLKISGAGSANGFDLGDLHGGAGISFDPKTGDVRFGGLTARGVGSTHGVDLGDLHGQVSISYSPRTGDIRLGALTINGRGMDGYTFSIQDLIGGVIGWAIPGKASWGNFQFDGENSQILSPEGTPLYFPPNKGPDPRPVSKVITTVAAPRDALLAIEAEMDAGQTINRRLLMQETIEMLMGGTGAAWSGADGIYVNDCKTAQVAGLNWKNPSGPVKTQGGSVPAEYDYDRGNAGNGGDYFESTDLTPASLTHYTLNDCMIAIEIGTAGAGYDVGVGANLRINSNSAGSTLANINGSAQASFALPQDDEIGILFVGRQDGANISFAWGKGAVTTVASASNAIPAGVLKLFTDGGASFSDRRIKKLWVGEWLGDTDRAALVDAFQNWSKGVGSYIEPHAELPFLVSRDVGPYLHASSQLIPTIDTFGRRVISYNYQLAGQPVGSDPDGGDLPTHARIGASDDAGRTWSYGLVLLPNPAVPDAEVIDGWVQQLPDGRCLITADHASPVDHNIWGVIIENPLADPSQWIFSKPAWLAKGFPGRMRIREDGQTMRWTASEHGGGINQYLGMTVRDSAPISTFISDVPYAGTAGGANSFPEMTTVETANGILAIYRTEAGYYGRYSLDEVTWGSEFEMPIPTPSSRTEITRSPSGRLVWAINDSDTQRRRPAVYLSDVDGDGSSFPYSVVFDERAENFSYFSIAFGRDHLSRYDGQIYVAYDHGRGRLGPANTYQNDLYLVVVDEASIVTAAATRQEPLILRTVREY